jgi:hypothetical protein
MLEDARTRRRHCGERSDEAIQGPRDDPWGASLRSQMTGLRQNH